MAIRRINIEDVLVFRGKFNAEFCPGVNILTGGNGIGKTTLLRAIAMRPILGFPYEATDYAMLNNDVISNMQGVLLPMGGKIELELYNRGHNTDRHISIPVGDTLSHPELYPMAKQYRLSYNNSEIDIIGQATLPVTNEITPNAAKILDKIKSIIQGEVVYESDTFFVVKSDGVKVPFVLEASGYRKFGLLWKLLRNGLLESGSVLFWDEPENSLNPELLSSLVDILLELSRNGVQIFLATHSELLAEYFAVNQHEGDEVMFYSLFKNKEGRIEADSNARFDLLKENKLTEEPVRLYEKQLKRGLGNG